jgi:hypothetical protein
MQAKGSQLRAEWRVLLYYQRFESAVAIVVELLLRLAAVTIAVALSCWLIRERGERQQRDAGLVGIER